MAKQGLIPEVPGHPDLSPMERAALVHEESSRITSLVADMALRDGKNMMWDITMSSESSVAKRVAALKAAGYQEINGVFVDIPVEVSVNRAMSRYRRGADGYRAGKGPGGRFVPPAIIRAQRTSTGETINRGVFDKIKGEFSQWSMYDNSVDGRAPELMGKSPTGAAMAGQVKKSIGRNADLYDVRGAVDEIRRRHGAVDVTTIDSDELWAILRRHDRSEAHWAAVERY